MIVLFSIGIQGNAEQSNSGSREGFSTYSMLLRSELLGVEEGVNQYSLNPQSQKKRRSGSGTSQSPINDDKSSGRGQSLSHSSMRR